jgi:hypothetical protein
MPDPGDRTDPALLEELATLTDTYARASAASPGILLTGVWILGAEWVLRSSVRAGQLLFMFMPLASLAFFSLARGYYQRHGEVIAKLEPGFSWIRPFFLGVVFFLALDGIEKQFQGPRQGHEHLAAAAFLATAMLASWVAHTRPQHFTTFWTFILLSASWANADPSRPGWDNWFRPVMGSLFVLAGVLTHLQYRRVERRLTALRARVP